MGSCKFLPCPCPLPLNSTAKDDHSIIIEDDNYSSSLTSQKTNNYNNSINSATDSSTNSSFSSQRSLPFVPSLTTPSSSNSQTTLRYQTLATLKGHSSQVFSLALAGKILFSGGSNGEILAWDPRMILDCSRRMNVISSTTVVEGNSAVKSMVVLEEDNKLITAHHDHKIRVWKIDASDKIQNSSSLAQERHNHHYKLITTLPTLNDRCTSLFSADNYVQIRRHKTSTWVHHVDAVSSLTLSPDGAFLYSVSWDRTLKIWRTSDFKCLESIQNAHEDAINSVIVLSKNGIVTVLTASADKTIKAWRKNYVENGGSNKTKHTLIFTLEKHKSAVNALAFSSDGSFLYSGACDRSIIVWGGLEKEEGCNNNIAVVGALRGHKKAILCLAVVGDLLFSGSADRTVRVWRREDVSRHCCLAVLEGHNGPIKCLSASSLMDLSEEEEDDDRGKCYIVYSGSLDFDVRVWEFWV